ncbi:MAG: DoxX family protein [Gammaproteobacteria bacterium]|jgi:putative oxidoreductase|nr:DoxX family protein [Gammaproteobacteria bacterium]
MQNAMMQNLLMLVGRVMLAAMMFWSGYGRLMSYASIHNYVADWGVPHAFKPLLVIWEVGGGLLLVTGAYTRAAALALALFCILSGFFVHLHDDDVLQLIDFMKNMALTGGFLYVAATGAGDWSLGKKYGLKWS